MRIELIEDKNGTFYQSGSAQLSANGQELLQLLAAELKTLPNELLIEGHTDATPYSTNASYTNWELSADRANSARRLLQQAGVRGNQVTQVRGYADQFLRVKSNPYDPSNRRISILVKNSSDGTAPPKIAGVAIAGEAPKAGNAKPVQSPAAPQSAPRAAAIPPPPAPTVAPVQAKPSPATPMAKPGLMDRLKGMMPGAKK